MVWSEVAGDRSARTVVLVHGSMDRSAGLLRLSRRLDGEHRVVRYDRRGYGRSADVGPPWDVEANIADLEGLIESTAEPVVGFGHSFGGNVVLALAERRPDLVGAVVVYEAPLSWLDWWPTDSAGAEAMRAADPAAAAEAFMRRLVGDAAWERLPESTRAGRRAEGAAMVAELVDLRRHPPWQPEHVTVPVLALHGEKAGPHHRAATEYLGELLGDCRVETVPEAGHAGPHTHAATVGALVTAFVRSLAVAD